MPWQKVTEMTIKLEFIRFALKEAEPFNALCRRYKISPKTGYKLLNRYKETGVEGLKDKSRRPHTHPGKTPTEIENAIILLRRKKPAWGSRKIRAYLQKQKGIRTPTESTITNILNRHELIPNKDRPVKAFERYEHAKANDLWQVDFKGHVAMHKGRCHPLTFLDDHSRFSLGVDACKNESAELVKSHFIGVFEQYGLPYRINFDNGTPWARIASGTQRYTSFSIWLLRLGIKVSYSRIKRPQTNGKIERFHQTLKRELLQYHYFYGIKEAQRHFDEWRFEYNFKRPHEAIAMETPSSRYQASNRKYSSTLPDIVYRPGDIIRKVDVGGKISYKNKKIFVGEGLRRLEVALRESEEEEYDIYFCNQKLISIDLKNY